MPWYLESTNREILLARNLKEVGNNYWLHFVFVLQTCELIDIIFEVFSL